MRCSVQNVVDLIAYAVGKGTLSIRAQVLARAGLIAILALLVCVPRQARGSDSEPDVGHEVQGCRNGAPGQEDLEFRGLRLLDSRHHLGRCYPLPGQVLDALPGYARIHGPDGDLLFADGVWYREVWSGHYAVVSPAFGTTIATLPRHYVTVKMGEVAYYYANNTYYVRSPEGYSVTEAQPDTLDPRWSRKKSISRSATPVTPPLVFETIP
jgi:hypothetical protein